MSLSTAVSSSFPWGPFILACLGRAFLLLSVALFFEDKVIGLVPALPRSYIYYAASSLIGIWFLRQVLSIVLQGPTPDMHVQVESGSFRENTVTWVACGMRGWRDAMEDAHVAEQLDKQVFKDALLFAVLDGHGGSEVSALASKLVVPEIEAHARKISKSFDGESQSALLTDALSAALPQLDSRLRTGGGLGWAMPRTMHPFNACGSTAVVAAVDFLSREVIVANVGDSRAILIREGKAISLTEDHKPENAGERNRIRAAGGKVIKMGPCHRVDGNLNLSRALGDFNLKSNLALPADKQKVIAYPDITRTAFKGGPGELLVVACDGLFERLSNQDLADIIWPKLKSGMALTRIATEVLHACCARSIRGRPVEEGTDNETVILVQLPGGGPSAATEAPDTALFGFAKGQRVSVANLESESGQQMNGKEGVIEGPSKSPGRLSVQVEGFGSKSIKPVNLKVLEASED
eukprot:TRINITY_DN1591_c0_g1_i7.p1 TRINITY_DN1591_c0_g1~~TRINITY_DN1591_c0_g1_i7.p1  ORF type:complete len:465 (-),score=71.55 TRINITY_DN1591_c0_g1_i7:389-1783(-)